LICYRIQVPRKGEAQYVRIRGDQEGWLPWWLAWGGGGHFVVCGVVRVIGAVILATTPDEQLDLAETAEGEAKKD